MLRTRELVVCSESAQRWYADAPAACLEENGHAHQHYEMHVHRDIVELPDRTSVMAVSFDSDDPYARDTKLDFGLYLDALWAPPWPHEHVDWPDFGVPDQRELTTALHALLSRARAGQLVELGCLGGHGRTGTALACLATLTGQPAGEAVCWVRDTYCTQAVETPAQKQFVESFGE